MQKLLKGSFIILIGTIIFRIGGYLYRVLMQYLLGVSGYGILSLTIPLQWVLILLAGGGLPPAVAKYVSEYLAKNDKYMVRQIIITSIKIMILLSAIFTTLIFFIAEPYAAFLHSGHDVAILFQIVGFITPFSIFLGLFRGVFQGYQNMTYILISRAVEQIFMITLAVSLILIGLYVLGAVIGTIIGFAVAAVVAVLLFIKTFWKDLKNAKKPITPVNEYQLAKKLLIFSLPIIVTGVAELALFETGTYIIKIFMDATAVGYYNIASPIARLPLVISGSIAITILPAASEALSLKNNHLVEKYVIYSYRYMLLVLIPLCVIIILFSQPIMAILFPRAPLAYFFAGGAMDILVIGMAFFSLYGVSASISQGLGKPYLPMYYLIIGTIINLSLTAILVPLYGLNGAAIATTVATFIIMIISTWKTIEISNTKLPYANLAKIIGASILAGLLIALLPKTVLGFIIALLIFPFIYILILAVTKSLERKDLEILNKFEYKLGPFSKYLMKMSRFLERFVK